MLTYKPLTKVGVEAQGMLCHRWFLDAELQGGVHQDCVKTDKRHGIRK